MFSKETWFVTLPCVRSFENPWFVNCAKDEADLQIYHCFPLSKQWHFASKMILITMLWEAFWPTNSCNFITMLALTVIESRLPNTCFLCAFWLFLYLWLGFLSIIVGLGIIHWIIKYLQSKWETVGFSKLTLISARGPWFCAWTDFMQKMLIEQTRVDSLYGLFDW